MTVRDQFVSSSELAWLALSCCIAWFSTGVVVVAESAETPIRWQWNVRIPLRDGVTLSGILYRPRELERAVPCIFTLTPYIAEGYQAQGVYFARSGYAFLAIDTRGRGNSQGRFRPLLQEARDGHDVVEWLARQPYCNGKVGMWGGSYSGYNQWATASQHPPHLAAIAPAAGPVAGVDFPSNGNIPGSYIMQWLTLVSGRTSQMGILSDGKFWLQQFRAHFRAHRSFAELDQAVGNPSSIFQEWIAHPDVDSYWDSYNPTARQYAAIDVPVLTITGQYDSVQAGALEHYRRHRANAPPAVFSRHFLVVGPWSHGQIIGGPWGPEQTNAREVGGLALGEASTVDLNQLHAEWYDWVMKSGPRPGFLQKPVAYYVTGREIWRYADTLESITSDTWALHLAAEQGSADGAIHTGRLQAAPQEQSVPDSYVYDPLASSPADLLEGEERGSLVMPATMTQPHGKFLVYQSEPFDADTEINGFFRLCAWISLDQPDTDLSAAVYEINADGNSLLLSRSQQRARYRSSVRHAAPVPRGHPLEYRFEGFPFVARQVRKGSRLRLVLGPVNSLYWQKNYNSGGVVARETSADARTVTVSVFHDRRHPSVLQVPLGGAAD